MDKKWKDSGLIVNLEVSILSLEAIELVVIWNLCMLRMVAIATGCVCIYGFEMKGFGYESNSNLDFDIVFYEFSILNLGAIELLVIWDPSC